MDNRIFNINGKTKEQLNLALKLLLLTEYGDNRKVSGWYINPKCGMILTWLAGEKYPRATPFTDRMGRPSDIEVNELTEILFDWLQTDEAKKIPCEGWDADLEHDGSNGDGWRLYCNDWGHVNEENGTTIDHYSIAAFKPVWLWYGK